MPTFPSIAILTQADTPVNATSAQDSTAVAGVSGGTWDVNGLVLPATLPAKQGSNVILDRMIITSELLAASVDKWVFGPVVTGVWRVAAVSHVQRVVGGSGAQIDVMVVTGTGVTAPAAGVTQLSAVCDLTITADTPTIKTLIASPTDIGPGGRIGLDFSGTLTNLVGLVQIEVVRIR